MLKASRYQEHNVSQIQSVNTRPYRNINIAINLSIRITFTVYL